MKELRTPLPLIVTGGENWKGPTGKALALFVAGEHPELNLIWTVVMRDTGQCWCVPNQFIRFGKNFTEGRYAVV